MKRTSSEKPPIATRMQIKGLNTQASDRSIALKLMSDYVKSRRGAGHSPVHRDTDHERAE